MTRLVLIYIQCPWLSIYRKYISNNTTIPTIYYFHHIYPCQCCPFTLIQKIFFTSNIFFVLYITAWYLKHSFINVSPTFLFTLLCRICQTPWTQQRSLTNWAFTPSVTATGTSRPLAPPVATACTRASTGWPTSSRTRSEANLWTAELQLIREHQWVFFLLCLQHESGESRPAQSPAAWPVLFTLCKNVTLNPNSHSDESPMTYNDRK